MNLLAIPTALGTAAIVGAVFLVLIVRDIRRAERRSPDYWRKRGVL